MWSNDQGPYISKFLYLDFDGAIKMLQSQNKFSLVKNQMVLYITVKCGAQRNVKNTIFPNNKI